MDDAPPPAADNEPAICDYCPALAVITLQVPVLNAETGDEVAWAGTRACWFHEAQGRIDVFRLIALQLGGKELVAMVEAEIERREREAGQE